MLLSTFARFGVGAVVVATGSAAAADTFQFTVDPGASSTDLTVSNALVTKGSVIGDYDPVTNPGGTQTRPGVFGGEGNHPIPIAAELTNKGGWSSSPTGSSRMIVDLVGGWFVLQGFSADALGGKPAKFPVALGLATETFHTVNPDAIFPGGEFPPLEFGEIRVTRFVADQAGPAGGTLDPVGPGEFAALAFVPVVITVGMEMLGWEFEVPVPGVLVQQGTLSVTEDGETALAITTLELDLDEEIALGWPGVEDLPIDVPTILPPGETAHLLFSATLEALVLDAHYNLFLVAVGERVCTADMNGDGALDLFDFLAFLNAFNAQHDAADCDASGSFNLFDFICFAAQFNAGC